jgi:hypothetical protein
VTCFIIVIELQIIYAVSSDYSGVNLVTNK